MPSSLNWISPALLIALSLLGFFLRHRIQRWATKGIEHHYDEKLEEIRSELRQKEESLKADLQRKDKEIDALRSPAMQAIVSRRNALTMKEIEAYDALWTAVETLAPFKAAARFMQPINLEFVFKKKSLDANEKSFFDTLHNLSGLANIRSTGSHSARPYVSASCWAKFAAYSSIGAYAASILTMFRSGVADRSLLEETNLKHLVATALPHHIELLEEKGVRASFHLLDELEDHILREIQEGIRGDKVAEDMASAQAIITASYDLSMQVEKFKVQVATPSNNDLTVPPVPPPMPAIPAQSRRVEPRTPRT